MTNAALAFATAAGLTAVFAASPIAYDVIRIAGAVYLVWLGVRALWRARRTACGEEAPTRRTVASMRTGFVTNLLNPKVGVVYMTLLPQFVPSGAPILPATLLLVTVHCVLGLAWFTLLVFTAGAMRQALTRPVIRRRLEQLAGVAFVGFGLRLAAESR